MTEDRSGGKPFEGVRVADLSRVLAGPYCGQILADMGAEVIKVESPEGDENRRWPPILPSGLSCNYASVNRGKKSLTLDLKSAEGRAALTKLVKWADVLLHSFLPGTASRLGLDYAKLAAINTRLIFCSISGYGEQGDLRDKPGYDLMVQAFSGAMSTTGYPGSPPTRIGVSYIDMSTGLSMYGAIATALYRRERTGKGAWVRGSLLETSVSLLGYHGVSWLQAGVLPVKQGSGGVYQVPYQAFRCADGEVMIGAPNNTAWTRLCEVLGVPELGADPRFHSSVARVEQRETLVPLIEKILATKPVAYWVERLEAARVAVAPIQTIDQVMSHRQVRDNGMVVKYRDKQGQEKELIASPFKLDNIGPAPDAPPDLGADSERVLRDDLGFTSEETQKILAATRAAPSEKA